LPTSKHCTDAAICYIVAIRRRNFPVSPNGDTEVNMRIRKPLDLGPLIRARRRVLGWSQNRLAQQAGVGRQWLVEVEGGKSGAPMDLVIKTLDALGYFLNISDDAPAHLLPRTEAVSQRGPSREGGGGGQRGELEANPPVHRRTPVAIEGPADAREKSGPPVAIRYQVTDFETIGFAADRDRFYDPGYRPMLTRMATHIIVAEAPIFEDLLARRIARAHGMARATRKLLKIAPQITEQKFARTTEGDRTIVWPENVDVQKLWPFRRAPLDARDHVDIPLMELASLAVGFLAGGSTPEETAVLMSRQIGLGRILTKTRLRLVEAAQLAQRYMSQQ
jgi:transcriptional regulator with XRE-family HTH domain